LIFLVLSLTVTPLMRLAQWSSLGQLRTVMGLYAFFHALVHFGLFYLFDRNANMGVLFAYRLGAYYVQLRVDSPRRCYEAERHPPPQPVESALPGKRWEGELRLAKVFVETPEVRTLQR
jgi:hypothetical protein